MPELFEEAFEDLGTSMKAEGVEVLKCDPNYRVWFPDNDCFELSTDFSKMKTKIEAHEGPGGFHKFLSFMQESGKHYELSVQHVLRKNFSSYANIFRPDFFATVFDMHPFESIYGRITRYFKTEKMRRVFTFASMYLGMSPYEAPATYSLLQYTEIAHGIGYPVGGFQSVSFTHSLDNSRTKLTFLGSASIG
jgi:phytoene desaturase (3,4-didehydrolycopene-forming)